jgi:hypothetical protein
MDKDKDKDKARELGRMLALWVKGDATWLDVERVAERRAKEPPALRAMLEKLAAAADRIPTIH